MSSVAQTFEVEGGIEYRIGRVRGSQRHEEIQNQILLAIRQSLSVRNPTCRVLILLSRTNPRPLQAEIAYYSLAPHRWLDGFCVGCVPEEAKIAKMA